MSMEKPKRKLQIRMLVVFVAFALVLGLLGVRLFFLQVVGGPELQREAVEQQTRDNEVASKRGTIYDRNRKVLAQSSTVETVTANPNEIRKSKKDALKIAAELSTVLEMDASDIQKLLDKETNHVTIKRKIDVEVATKVRELDLTGIYLQEDSKRYYPYGAFASHVIGFTGTDNQGLAGIEMVYDKELRGVPGRVISLKNALDTDMPFQEEKHIDPQNGTNVVLTIDEVIQHFAEKHLETAFQEEKVQQGAAVIVMDVQTGETLAMSAKPDFDLNHPFELVDETEKARIAAIADEEERTQEKSNALQKMWRNKAVVDSYEPGSCFKIITASMALEEGVVNVDTPFFCPGYKVVADRRIACANRNGHGAQTFKDGVKNSCNPVFIEVGQMVGADLFQKYYKAFGFLETTGFDLPGEAKGVFYPPNGFGLMELSTSAFGQGPKITPLQMISAVCAVANGGNLMKPYLVKELVDDDGNVLKSTEPTLVRQVISKETSETMRMLLENVVANGSGQNAYIKGYRIAGKTGTSEKLPRGNGKYVSSFVGFAPANDPKIACLVMLDEASNGQYYGGLIAAPVVGKILEDTLRYLKIEPQYTEEEKENLDVFVPDVKGKSKSAAIHDITAQNLTYTIVGDGETIKDQMPKVGSNMTARSTVILYTEENTGNLVTVPDVQNLSLAEVQSRLQASKLNLNVSSAGATGNKSQRTIALKQDPEAGTQVEAGSIVNVQFRFLDVD